MTITYPPYWDTPLPEWALILLGGVWVFLMFITVMVFVDELLKEQDAEPEHDPATCQKCRDNR